VSICPLALVVLVFVVAQTTTGMAAGALTTAGLSAARAVGTTLAMIAAAIQVPKNFRMPSPLLLVLDQSAGVSSRLMLDRSAVKRTSRLSR